MHYRSGPSLGLTFEEAKAAGLQSAARGKAAYDAYVRAYNAMREGRRVAAPEPEPLRYKGTLTLHTFSKIKGAVNSCIAKAQGKPWVDSRGRIYQPQPQQTSSKIPMKKEKR